MNNYYVISSIANIDNHYAIKLVESNEEIKINSKKLSFDIDETKLIYVGVESSYVNNYSKIDFYLDRCKTKLNKQIYKIDLLGALGRIAYGNETLFLDESISKNTFDKAIELERIRLIKFENSTEISGAAKDKILKKYESIENAWLSYWKNSKVRLLAFYAKHPEPQEKDYHRSGLSSLLYGKFDKQKFEADGSSHYKKLDWLCTKIALESEDLKIDFSAQCPSDCGGKVNFLINFAFEESSMVYIDNSFPYGVYKKLSDVSGACSECGLFSLTFDDDEYTCIFRNYIPEIIHYVIKKIIKDSIAYSIEKQILGQ